MPSKAEQAKAILQIKATPEPVLRDRDFVSTGVTLINLATYGKTHGGMTKGKIYRLAGVSGAGKTFLARTILAEAAINPSFDDYELIYNDIERGALMDTEKFFGSTLVKRLKAPGYGAKTHSPVYSRTIGDFYEHLHSKLDKGKKFIEIVDSMDALSPIVETKMTDGKAKYNSQNLRKIIDKLEATGSILVIVSQAHVDMKSMFGGYIAAGGSALLFYSTLDIWLRQSKTLKVIYKGKKFNNGVIISARIQKNRLSGQATTVYFPFHPSYGIDDIGANVDFLCRSEHWAKSKGVITASEFDFSGNRTELIRKIETEQSQRELQVLVGKVWNTIQEAIAVKREPRYQ